MAAPQRIPYEILKVQLQELAAQGLSLVEISNKISVSKHLISRCAKRYSIALPDGRAKAGLSRLRYFPCVICGTSFHTKKSNYESCTRRTCSKQCSNKLKSKTNHKYAKVEKTCSICSTKFLIKPSKAASAQTCSVKCRVQASKSIPSKQKKGIEHVLRALPEHLTIDPSTFKGIKQKAKFIDSEFGEWWTNPEYIMQGHGHPARGRKTVGSKIRQSLKDAGHCNILPNGKAVKEYAAERKADPTTALKVFNKLGSEECQKWIDAYERRITDIEAIVASCLKNLGIVTDKYDKTVPELAAKGMLHKPDFRIEHNGKILYIDADGLRWHSEEFMSNDRHFNRMRDFRDNGLNLLIFRADELYYKTEIVQSIIGAKLNIYQNKYWARKLDVKEVPNSQAQEFLSNNHIMGEYSAAKHIGLYNGTELVSLLSYRKHNDGIDISRFCNKLNTCVIGGLSKLFAAVKKQAKFNFIQSFVDLRYGDGHSLIKLGFRLESTNLSWKWSDGTRTYNRLKCRANMDSRGLSEAEHAKELKWVRIYDAGQAKFVLHANGENL